MRYIEIVTWQDIHNILAAEYATGRHVKRGRAWVCARNGTMATALDWQWARVEMCSPIGDRLDVLDTTRHYEHWVNALLSSVRTCRGLHAFARERASPSPLRCLHNARTREYLHSTGFCHILSADTWPWPPITVAFVHRLFGGTAERCVYYYLAT